MLLSFNFTFLNTSHVQLVIKIFYYYRIIIFESKIIIITNIPDGVMNFEQTNLNHHVTCIAVRHSFELFAKVFSFRCQCLRHIFRILSIKDQSQNFIWHYYCVTDAANESQNHITDLMEICRSRGAEFLRMNRVFGLNLYLFLNYYYSVLFVTCVTKWKLIGV